MVNNKVAIKVFHDDKERLVNECKDEFLRHHPEMEGMWLSQAFMLKKVIDYYLEDH